MKILIKTNYFYTDFLSISFDYLSIQTTDDPSYLTVRILNRLSLSATLKCALLRPVTCPVFVINQNCYQEKRNPSHPILFHLILDLTHTSLDPVLVIANNIWLLGAPFKNLVKIHTEMPFQPNLKRKKSVCRSASSFIRCIEWLFEVILNRHQLDTIQYVL